MALQYGEERLDEDYGAPYVPTTAAGALPGPAPAPAPTPTPAPAGALPGPTPTPTPAPAGPLSDPYAGIANAPTLSAQVQQAWAEAQANPLIMQGLAAQGITSPEQLATLFPPEAVPGVHFYTNAGRPAGVDGTGYVQGYINYDPNGQYRLLDNTNNKAVVYEGSGYAGLDETQRRAAEMSARGGTGASWTVQVKDPATGQWVTQARDEPKSQVGGMIADVALPAFLAAVAVASGGTLTPLMTALYAGGGSAMGSALSSAIQGRPFDEALLRAGISGVLAGTGAYAAPGLSDAISTALGSVGGGAGGSSVASGAGGALGDIIVTAPSLGTGILGGAGGSIAGGLSGQALTDYIASQTSGLQQPQVSGPNDIVVTGTPPTAPNPGVGLGGLPGPTFPADTNIGHPATSDEIANATNTDEIRVTGEIPDPVLPPPTPPTFPLDTGIGNPATSQEIADATTPDDGKGFGFNEAGQALRLLSLITGLGGSALGLGGGGKGAGFIKNAGNIGNLPPSFHASLPTDVTIPGTGGSKSLRTRLAMPAQDWDLYGTRPQQSFFSGSNSRYTPPAPGIFDQWGNGMSRGYATGGAVEADGGPLTLLPGLARGGRADDVPAMLSDGEYVIDAETVALLGDGSFDEGSRKLDSLRVNIRKHKGRNLAKGKISPPARDAERYLGGR